MPNYSSPHMPDSPSSFFYTNMIAPSVLGVKIIGRLDSMSTENIWIGKNQYIDKISPKRVIVDASGIEYCDSSEPGCIDGRPIKESQEHIWF